jgi:hypothetical protein
LRDLWRWQHAVADGAIRERVIRGDATVVDVVDVGPAATALVDLAASYARWDVVVGLVRRGTPIGTTGRTALHFAAGCGELDVVQLLLEHGADPSAKDPEFHATPLQWADYLRKPQVVEYLRSQSSDGAGTA